MRFSSSHTYWFVVVGLLLLSGYFAFRVEQFRAGLVQGSGELCLSVGEDAVVERVVDGDELLVAQGECVVLVRLLGIKAFDPIKADLALRPTARRTVERLERLQGENVTVVGPETLELDSQKRTLAHLTVNGKDLGQDLVREGLALVYRKYPFAKMDDYLSAEAAAESDHAGLWGQETTAERARALRASFERERQQ